MGFVYANGDLEAVKNANGDFVFLLAKRATNSTDDQYFVQKIGLDGSTKYTSSGKLIYNAQEVNIVLTLPKREIK